MVGIFFAGYAVNYQLVVGVYVVVQLARLKCQRNVRLEIGKVRSSLGT
jgi:hypothetical protein